MHSLLDSSLLGCFRSFIQVFPVSPDSQELLDNDAKQKFVSSTFKTFAWIRQSPFCFDFTILDKFASDGKCARKFLLSSLKLAGVFNVCLGCLWWCYDEHSSFLAEKL